jgi:hypothetical protein
MPVSRRKKIVVAAEKKEKLLEKPKPESIYCRKCMLQKPPEDFFNSVDKTLDSNGYMSICKDCIQEILDHALLREKTLENTFLSVCRTLNVSYEEAGIRSLRISLENAEKDERKFSLTFGRYLVILNGLARSNRGEKSLTFREPVDPAKLEKLDADNLGEDMVSYLEKFWGKGEGYEQEDYKYLESELSEWQKTTRCDTQPELVLVKEICYQQNEIRRLRKEGKSVAKAVEQLQVLMKNSALTPYQQNAASAGRNMETFGVWINEIEKTSPAEYYKDKEKFKDIDGIGDYAEKYIVRSLRNFVTGSRDFNLDEIVSLDGDADDEGE